MRAAAENAIRLDPLLAEAHDALGDGLHARGEMGAIGSKLPPRD